MKIMLTQIGIKKVNLLFQLVGKSYCKEYFVLTYLYNEFYNIINLSRNYIIIIYYLLLLLWY